MKWGMKVLVQKGHKLQAAPIWPLRVAMERTGSESLSCLSPCDAQSFWCSGGRLGWAGSLGPYKLECSHEMQPTWVFLLRMPWTEEQKWTRLSHSSVPENIDWNQPPWPDTIATICLSYFLTGGLGKKHGTNKSPPTRRIQKRSKGDVTCLLPPRILLATIHLSWAMCAPTERTLSQNDWPKIILKFIPSP